MRYQFIPFVLFNNKYQSNKKEDKCQQIRRFHTCQPSQIIFFQIRFFIFKIFFGKSMPQNKPTDDKKKLDPQNSIHAERSPISLNKISFKHFLVQKIGNMCNANHHEDGNEPEPVYLWKVKAA